MRRSSLSDVIRFQQVSRRWPADGFPTAGSLIVAVQTEAEMHRCLQQVRPVVERCQL
jgi:hypothetical protein